MANTILVAYASKYGATAGIAEKIGEVLRQDGFQVDVLPADNVKDITPYKAIIIGSASYIGQWRKEAVKLLSNNEKSLAERQIWLFSSGPLGEGDAAELMKGWRFPEKLRPVIDRIQPRDITVFHGAIDMTKLNALEKFAIKKVKSPIGDFRDWDAITSWAKAISQELKKQE